MICIFISLSFYLWLLWSFLVQKFFLLVKKVELVCGSVFVCIWLKKALSRYIVWYLVWILFCFIFHFYFDIIICMLVIYLWAVVSSILRQYSQSHVLVFLCSSFHIVICVVFKISIRMLRQSGIETVALVHGLLR